MRAYRLPVLSGILLALAFYPFYLWPLALFALIPLFYFAASVRHSRKILFLGGCIAGFIGTGPLVYFSLFQLRIIPGGELFYYLIRASSVPVLLIMSLLFGALVVLYAALRTRSALCNALAAAALYGLLEIALFSLFGGYYPDSLSRAVVSLSPSMTLAALFGALSVSVAIAGFCALCAELLAAPKGEKKPVFFLLALSLAVLLGAHVAYRAYIGTPAIQMKKTSVAVIQIISASPDDLPYGTQGQDGSFTNPVLEGRIGDAAEGADLVVYPYTPFRGLTYRGDTPTSPFFAHIPDAALGTWLNSFVSTSTSVLLWNSLSVNNVLYDEYAMWRGGQESEYRKRQLYAFADYIPHWIDFLHLQNFRYTITPGEKDPDFLLDGVKVGGLICSELHQDDLSRSTAQDVPLIIAVGSDAMFPGDLAGNYSLATAQYRAAENNIPMIRANIRGPSAIINPDGSIEARLGFEQEGTLRGDVFIGARKKTLYDAAGSLPLYAIMGASLAYAFFRRYPNFFRGPGKKEQG